MLRGIMFVLGVWWIVTMCIVIFSHLTNADKMGVVKAGTYGAFTALVSGLLVACVVLLF